MIRDLIRAASAFCGADVPEDAHADLAARISNRIADLPASERRLLRLGSFVLDLLPLPRHLRRFRNLDRPRAELVLRWCARAPIGQIRRLHRSLKMLLQFAWYSDPARWPEVGYDGPWLGRVAVEAGPPPRLIPPAGSGEGSGA